MKYGLDMVIPPRQSQALVMRGLGYTFCGVYVGGPRATSHHAWQIVEGISYPVQILQGIFSDGFLPIYVGRNSGNSTANRWDDWDDITAFTQEQGRLDAIEADSDTGACGFDSHTPICLDVEYGTYQVHPNETTNYIRGFAEEVRTSGHVFGIYADAGTIGGLKGQHPDFVDFYWGASWVKGWTGLVNPKAPFGRFNPAEPPPWDAWQFGGGTIAGVSVDLNSSTDDFAFAKYAL